jgi:hypothetical protein
VGACLLLSTRLCPNFFVQASDPWPPSPAPCLQGRVQFEPDCAIQRISADELADTAESVVDAAPVKMELGGYILHGAVIVVQQFQHGQKFTVLVLILQSAEVHGSGVVPAAGGQQAIEKLVDAHGPAVHKLS